MQDSTEAAAKEDMEKELETMSQVYKSATMTIVAACAPSATCGFLHDRPRPSKTRYSIPCRLGPDRFFVSHVKEHIVYYDKTEPINSRAWTFQEALISPRLLIYASHTLQWQCRTLTCNLGASYHAPGLSSAPRLPSPQGELLRAPGTTQKSDQTDSDLSHDNLQLWLKIVVSYATRKSSLSSDKLPALSALAVSYAPIFGPHYLAGIWAKSAVQQLCWSIPDSREFFTRPTEYRAPSWSWAALDGPIYFPSFLRSHNASVCVQHHHFRIVEWKINLKADRLLYGEVTHGRLTVTGVLRDAIFDPSSSPAVRFVPVLRQCLDDMVAIASSMGAALGQSGRASSDTVEDNFKRPIRCLAMYHSDGPKSPRIGSLMLAESMEHKDLYRRVGLCDVDISMFEGFPTVTLTII